MSERPTIAIGVGLVVVNERGQILLARRTVRGNGHETYALMGGGMEKGESFEQTVLRELVEECGDHVKIKNLRFLCLMNHLSEGDGQWVGAGFMAELAEGEPKLMEPHKNEAWAWYDPDNLPDPVYRPSRAVITAYLTGRTFFDA